MASNIRLVPSNSPLLEHSSTQVVAEYDSGEKLIRTDAVQVESESRSASESPHGLLIDGVEETDIVRAETVRMSEQPEPLLAYVELAGPVLPGWLETLTQLGVEPMRFQPRTSYLCRATPVAFDEAAKLDFVIRVVPLVSDFKSRPNLPEAGSNKAWVVIDVPAAPGDSSGASNQGAVSLALERLKQIDGITIDESLKVGVAANLGRVPVLIDDSALKEAMDLSFVLSVEIRSPVRPEDEVAGLILAGSYNSQGRPSGDYSQWLTNHGISGRGVAIGIVDNGVDETHEAFSGRIVSRDNGRAWHGTFVAGHAAGNYLAERDRDGFIYGLGTAPAAEIISQDNNGAAPDLCRETVVTSGPGGASGSIQNNSWGVGTHDPMDYRSLEASYDALVRNATPADSTARPITICFSAGNSGSSGLTRPKAAKNVIVTGNSENYRPTAGGSDSDNIDHLFTGSHPSSHGNCGDGRVRPDVIAPGEWTASANFDSFPGQTEYISPKLTWGGGTSGASPKTAGACALLTQWWRDRNSGTDPSPALLRAMIVNGAEDTGFGGPIPNSRQGWGRLNLANILSDDIHHVYVDQSSLLQHRGETRSWRLRVADPDMPVRVTLAWTDPPGPVTSGTATVPAIVNSLGLTLHTSSQIYHGNNFTNGFSVKGELPSSRTPGEDNLQNIFVARGDTNSPFTVEVRALNITTNCLTGSVMNPRQDFALVVTNAYVDAGFVPLDLFMLIDDTSPGAMSTVDDVVIGGDDDELVNHNNSEPTLRRGDSGDDVRRLQTLLDQSGFLTGSIDGQFGFGTQSNVKSFQRSVGLGADGIVGDATWSALKSATGNSDGDDAGPIDHGGDDTGPVDTGGGDHAPVTSQPTLRFGSRGDDVRHLQSLLVSVGHLSGSADGIFGHGTLRAVKSFQRANGLSADGVVGAGTWSALDAAAGGSTDPVDNSDPVDPFNPFDDDTDTGHTGGGHTDHNDTGHNDHAPVVSRPTVRYRSRGEHVRFLQQRLSVLGFLSGSIDGIFGNGTLRAVKAFQRANGLSIDGVVGPGTWAALQSTETQRDGNNAKNLESSRTVGPKEAAVAESLVRSVESAMRNAPDSSMLVSSPKSEHSRKGAKAFTQSLLALADRIDAREEDLKRASALVVVGGQTKVDQQGLSVLRRLALNGGLFLVSTSSAVLNAVLQGIHLKHGVYPRLAEEGKLASAVRKAAAQASGLQEMVLNTTDYFLEDSVFTLTSKFDLTQDDTRAVIEFSGVAAPELQVTPPVGAPYRVTTSSRRKGVKLTLEDSLLTLQLQQSESRPWSGQWSVRVMDRETQSPIQAQAFAGAGPILTMRCQTAGATEGESSRLLCVQAGDGTQLSKLQAKPADGGTANLAIEDNDWPVERVAKPCRLDAVDVEWLRSDTDELKEETSLSVLFPVECNSDEPKLLNLQLSVEGSTERGELFRRILPYSTWQLIPRGTWNQRSGKHAEKVRSLKKGTAGRLGLQNLSNAKELSLAKSKYTHRPILHSRKAKPLVKPKFLDLAAVTKLPVMRFPILPVPSPSSPINVGGYLIWADKANRTVWFMLAEPMRSEFSFVLERDEDFRVSGASATLVTGVFPAQAMMTMPKTWLDALSRSGVNAAQWKIEPLRLNRLEASLDVPASHYRVAPRVTTNPRLGTAAVLIELSALGAQIWHQALEGNGAPPGTTELTGWYVGGQSDNLAARSQRVNTTLDSLLRGVTAEAVRVIDPEVAFEASLRVDGDPTIDSITVEFRGSNSGVRTETFDSEGGTLSMRLVSTNPRAERIDWQVRVMFTAASWPPLHVSGTLSDQTGWSELLAPSSWLRSISLMTILIGEDGSVLPSGESDTSNLVTGSVDFTAPFLEGSASLHTSFETSSQESTTVLAPRPPMEPPGELKLTVFALRDGRDEMTVRVLQPDEEWVLVKVYANARIDIVTNRTPGSETVREDSNTIAAIQALSALTGPN